MLSKLLIVDDDPSARETLEAILAGEDYLLEYASNGQQALDKASSISPDLILLDVMMPVMDGYEVCRKFKEQHLNWLKFPSSC